MRVVFRVKTSSMNRRRNDSRRASERKGNAQRPNHLTPDQVLIRAIREIRGAPPAPSHRQFCFRVFPVFRGETATPRPLRPPSRPSRFNHPSRQPRITPMPRINPPSVRSVKSVVLPRPLQTADSASVYSVCSVVKPPPHDLFAPFAVQSPEQTTTDHTDSTDQSPIRAIREIRGAPPAPSRPQLCFRVARVFRGETATPRSLRAPSRPSRFNHPSRRPRIIPMPRIILSSVRSVKSVVLPRPFAPPTLLPCSPCVPWCSQSMRPSSGLF